MIIKARVIRFFRMFRVISIMGVIRNARDIWGYLGY
jgi:hypothetical protein